MFGGWRTGLPGPVIVLQAGTAVNYFGTGLVLPFEIIYLHQARGFPTATAGLVLATVMGTVAVVTPSSGALLDRFRAIAHDRLFLTLIAANIVLIMTGGALFSNILAPFAKAHMPVGPGEIGIVIFISTFTIVVAQIPATQVVKQMRRTHALAATSALFAIGLLAVLLATLTSSALVLGDPADHHTCKATGRPHDGPQDLAAGLWGSQKRDRGG